MTILKNIEEINKLREGAKFLPLFCMKRLKKPLLEQRR